MCVWGGGACVRACACMRGCVGACVHVWTLQKFSSTNQSEMQGCTQIYGRRPYGVGMLVAGYDVSVAACVK